ncbi:MAG: SMP-30/gluconolactonase/LRE family protein, partial [Leptolinea sp.]
MNKRLRPLIILSLLLMAALSACGRPPALPQDQSPPAETSQSQVQQEQPQPTQSQEVVPGAPAPADVTVAKGFPQNFNLTQLAGSYQFTEGPAVDSTGNVYFSDINAGRIYKWSPGGNMNVFLKGLNKPNGLMFDKSGDLITCEGGSGRLISIDNQGQVN